MANSQNGSTPFSANYLEGLKTQARIGALLTAFSLVSPRFSYKNIKNPNRIGIFSQWGVGDAVLLLPLLRGLRAAFPDVSLELIGKPWLSDLFADEDCCDRTHTLVPPWTAYSRKYRPTLRQIKSYLSQIMHLRKESFDWLISARFDPRETLQTRLLRAPVTYGFRAAGGRYWITNDLGMNRITYDSMHRAEVATEVCRSITATVDENPLLFRAKAPAPDWLTDGGYKGGGVLAIHTGAGHPIRRWPDDHFDQVLRRLSIKPGFVVFIEDPEGTGTRWDGPLPHLHWRGTLSTLKTMLADCDVFLGTDSGIMHMAYAAGCEVVTIFGPGEPRWFGPLGSSHQVVYKDVMPCRPCFDKCVYSSPLCMQNIDSSIIVQALDHRLKKFESRA